MKNVKALTDDELVGLYAEGNNEAFDTLLNKYQSRLFSYIYYVVRNVHGGWRPLQRIR